MAMSPLSGRLAVILHADGRFQIVFEVRYVIGMVDLERKSSSYCIRGAMKCVITDQLWNQRTVQET